MSQGPRTFPIAEIPDRSCPSHLLRSGGDVAEAVAKGFEHLLRTLSALPPRSISAGMRLWYQPIAEAAQAQRRLTLQLAAQAHQRELCASLEPLLDRSSIWRFYQPQPDGKALFDRRGLRAACDVVRRQSIFPPSVLPEQNAKVPPAYWSVMPFTPRMDNDYLILDSLLDRLDEPVLVEMCAEPTDAAGVLVELTRYLSLLGAVNRSWDADEEGFGSGLWSGDRQWQAALKPLRQRDPLADELPRRLRPVHEALLLPQLRFHVRVYAATPDTARLVASTVAAAGLEDGSYGLVDSVAKRIPAVEDLRAVPVSPEQQFSDPEHLRLFGGLLDMGQIAPVEELLGLFRLPIASADSPRCIRKDTDPPFEETGDLIALGRDCRGTDDTASGITRGIPVSKLVKHVFIGGMPGSGKTDTVHGILLQLARRGIPFVVFEPGKSEYRRLKCLRDHRDSDAKRLGRQLRVYRPGCEEISPLRINPLFVPPGIGRHEHIDSVLRCFQAAMPMAGPIPGVLGEACERIYEQKPESDHPPRLTDLCAAAREILAEKGYSGEVDSDLRAAIEVRLGAMTRRATGRVFQCPRSIPDLSELTAGFTIVELAALGQEQACLLTLFALSQIREHVKTTPWSGQGVRLVVVLEEAHNLVGRSTDARPSEVHADPKAFAAEFVCRMLAELRALGVAIIIVDQLPSAVAPEVIKNTASKLAFRQVDLEDREQLGATMLFGPLEMEEVARLQPGEAYFHTEGYFSPRRIRAPHIEAELDLPPAPLGQALSHLLEGEGWFQDAGKARLFAEFAQLREEMDRFEDTRARMTAQAARLVARRPAILHAGGAGRVGDGLRSLAGEAAGLRRHLVKAFEAFRRDVYRPLLGDAPGLKVADRQLVAMREQLIQRFESVIQAGIRDCAATLDRLIDDCRPAADNP